MPKSPPAKHEPWCALHENPESGWCCDCALQVTVIDGTYCVLDFDNDDEETDGDDSADDETD